MSELNINDLPGEIQTQVFRYLNGGDLKNATLTCKSWNNLIESTCRWSLTLFYDDYGQLWRENPCRAEEKNFFRTTNRKFGKIEIFGGYLTEDTRIHEIFHRHGLNVVQLRCFGGRIHNLVAFAELLNLTPNLTNVVICAKPSHGSRNDDERLEQVLPAMKKLKNLEISLCDQRIIKCFRKAKLTQLLIWEDKRSEHYGPMIEFISSQEMLTSLGAVSIWILNEMGRLNVPMPFRLTELAIYSYNEIYSDGVAKFVRSQAQNLRKIELVGHIPHSVYECVFASMTKLNTLSVRVGDLPEDNDFYERLQENSSIRTIKLLDYDLNESQFLGKFLKNLPNIRDLLLSHFGCVDQGVLKAMADAMAQNLGNVESLSIDSISSRSSRLIGCVKFPNLKKLHIGRLCGKIIWNEFTKIHSRLVELTIERTKNSFLTSDDFDQITTNADLQSIRLGEGFVADDRFFEITREKCTNLKVLDLHKSCISDGLMQNVEINVLRLCDDIECSKTLDIHPWQSIMKNFC